jgi:hypothetical protein
MDKQFTLLRNLIIVVVLAVVFSLFTLWLIDSWIKYPLFLFEIFTIIILYLIISGYEIRIVMKCTSKLRLNWGLTIDATLVSSSVALLALASSPADGDLIRAILALLCTSLLPGYALLNISGLIRYFTRLEGILLSYILSYIYTGLLVLILLPISESLRETTILLSYIALGMLSVLTHWHHPLTFMEGSLARRIDILALLPSTVFYALSFYFIYPGFALLPGSDISQHYANSIVLWRTPELYSAFPYFLAHLHESAFIVLSNAPVTVVQTTLVLLNLMMPIAFYIMAKNYMEGIDVRPAISTIFYSTFSGFAWMYLARLKLEGVQGFTLGLLNMVNDKAYNGAMYLAQPFLWFVPLSMSFTILIVQLMLLKKSNVSEKGFMALFSLLTIASFMVHVTEAIIFSLFISFYAFFSKGEGLRIDEALKSSLFGFAFLDVFYLTLQYVFGRPLGFSTSTTLLLPTLVLTFMCIYRRLAQDKVTRFLSRFAVKSLATVIYYIISFAYVLGFIAWVAGIPSFHTWMVVDVGSIPWFIYPILLGVTGLLMMAGLYPLLQNSGERRVMIFVALIIFSFVFGKTLTFVNVNFFDTGYWEKRFTAYYFLASAVIAPISVIRLFEVIRVHWNGIKKTLVTVAVVCLITIYGLQSTFIVLEYWNTFSASKPSREEFEAVNFLANIINKDKYAYTITLTRGSYNILSFSAPPHELTGMQIIYTAENPAMPLLSMKAHNLSHAYLYLHKRDFDILNRYGGSWLARHLIPMLPTVYRNSEVTIYNVSSVSFPQPNSNTALVVPFDGFIDSREGWLYAYDILSLGEYNYTVVYDLDPKTLTYNTVILSFDPPSNNTLKESFKEDFSSESGWKPVSGTWQYVGRGLQAGKQAEYQDAVILSPISAQNFTASLSFNPLEGDTKVANYVSIIFDWENEKNFKYAGLLFDSSGVIYAYISSCTDGNVINYPPWPGLNTGLKWQFGNSYNLTLSVKGKKVLLYVNGTQCLSADTMVSGGRLGIRSTRFYKVLFTSFKADTFTSLQLRDVNNYLDYVRSGGRLIILNTNGYGYFAERMLARDNSTIEAREVSGASWGVTLPTKVTMQTFSPKHRDVNVIANYKSQSGFSAYAVREEIGSGEIVYVNLYPIVETIGQTQEKATFYSLLGRLLQPAEVQLEPFRYVPPPLTATFKEVGMSGDIHVNASSLLFPLKVGFENVKVVDNSGKTSSIFNVTGLRLFNYGNVSISSSNLTLSEGRDFYSKLKFKDDVTITFNDSSVSVALTTKNGNTVQFNNVKTLSIKNYGQIDLYAREPTINVQGSAYFKELYSSGAIYQRTRTQGQDLKINGTIALKMYLSDIYSWAGSFDASGVFERSPPLLSYDEIASLPQAALWSIVLVLIFITLVFITYRGKGQNQDLSLT